MIANCLVCRRLYAVGWAVASQPFLEIGVVFPAGAQTRAGDGRAHYELATRLSDACTRSRIFLTAVSFEKIRICIMMELPDEDFAARKLICYRGIARLPLHALNYGHKIVRDKHRKISHENVIRLEKKYEQVGCERLQEENVVNAIVKDDDLIAALSPHGISLDEMCNLRWPQDAPALQIENVQCLSGMHRIEAARRFLNENDKWWIVRLFSYGQSGASHSLLLLTPEQTPLKKY
jgi:hypothetical protein